MPAFGRFWGPLRGALHSAEISQQRSALLDPTRVRGDPHAHASSTPNGTQVSSIFSSDSAAARVGRALITAALLLTICVYVGLNRVSATQARDLEPLTTEEIASAIPSGEALRLLSLGHNEAMADLIWLNALSFYGRYRIVNTDVRWLDPHINAIATVDPKFRLVYEWAGAVIMYGGEINNESVMAANEVLERGVERFPYDWSLRMMLGVNYTYELIPRTPAELELEESWRRYGAEQLAIGADLPNAPDNLRLASTSLLRRRAGWERVAQSIEESYLSASSDQARTVRRHAEAHLPPLEFQALLRHREAMIRLDDSPHWGFDAHDLTLYIHPDPILWYQPDELVPPPFELTR